MKILTHVIYTSILSLASMPVFAIDWSDCRIEAPNAAFSVAAGCAHFSVPENRNLPLTESNSIHLNLAAVWSSNKKPTADPILFLAGGPGQSAIESFVQIQTGFSQLLKDRHVYLVDQRGTGKSNPLSCKIDSEFLLKVPSEEESQLFLKKCLSEFKADTKYYTTTESIKDLEEIRKALGITQWNLIGVSYGTRKALTYAKLYPQSIRTMVLDGVAPQQEPLAQSHEQNLLSALQRQFLECSKQTPCKQAFGDVEATLTELLTQADSKPLTVNIPDPVSGQPKQIVLTREVITTVVRMFSYTPENYRLLPLLLDLAKKGQAENLAAQGLLIFNTLSDSIALGMDLSVSCAEDAPFYTPDPKATTFFSAEAMSVTRKQQCQLWPHIAVDPSFKEPVQSDIPSLLLSGEFDPVTPPQFAELAAKTLSQSQHLIAKGLGHGVFMRACMPFVIRDFIDNPAATLDVKCMDSFTPPAFFIDLMGPKQ